MTMTTTLHVDGGTEVTILHEGVPEAIPADANGTRMALTKLAALVEADPR